MSESIQNLGVGPNSNKLSRQLTKVLASEIFVPEFSRRAALRTNCTGVCITEIMTSTQSSTARYSLFKYSYLHLTDVPMSSFRFNFWAGGCIFKGQKPHSSECFLSRFDAHKSVWAKLVSACLNYGRIYIRVFLDLVSTCIDIVFESKKSVSKHMQKIFSLRNCCIHCELNVKQERQSFFDFPNLQTKLWWNFFCETCWFRR